MTCKHDPAFPWEQSQDNQSNLGLTKREWMATMILSGVMARTGNPPDILEIEAEDAVKAADALIAALNREPPNA